MLIISTLPSPSRKNSRLKNLVLGKFLSYLCINERRKRREVAIYDENATRDLPLFISGVDITVAPNTTGMTRKARIYATSFNKTDTIEIIQAAE